jgi:hypothetical protein
VLLQPVHLVLAVIINCQRIALRIPHVPGGYVVIDFALPVACRVILVTDVAAVFINIADLAVYAPVYVGDPFVAIGKQVTNLVIGIAGAAFQIAAVVITAGWIVCYAVQLVIGFMLLWRSRLSAASPPTGGSHCTGLNHKAGIRSNP